MSYPPALRARLHKTLASTQCSVEDMARLGFGSWHAAVLLDDTQDLSSIDVQTFNDRSLVGDTPLDIAYLLNRVDLIQKLEALGAVGDKQRRDWRGRGTFMAHDKYLHLPARQGNVKTLEARFRLGANLNDRDVGGNTPLHVLAINGHLKAVRYFTANRLLFELDMNAKNSEGLTARNLATFNGHHGIAQQLLMCEIDNCISAARIWHEMSAGRAEGYRGASTSPT